MNPAQEQAIINEFAALGIAVFIVALGAWLWMIGQSIRAALKRKAYRRVEQRIDAMLEAAQKRMNESAH